MADENTAPPAKKRCFVIGPIGRADSQTRIDADFLLEMVIKPVLERDPFSYEVMRADMDVSPGSINSAVLTAVMTADLAIADLSERNANAFYELGVRHFTQKPVIHMVRDVGDIPFDNIDQRALEFSTASVAGIRAAQQRLLAAVESVERGASPVSNPVTMAVGYQRRSVEGDDTDKTLNLLVSEIERLVTRMHRIEVAHKNDIEAIMSLSRKDVGKYNNFENINKKVKSQLYTSNAIASILGISTEQMNEIRKYSDDNPNMLFNSGKTIVSPKDDPGEDVDRDS